MTKTHRRLLAGAVLVLAAGFTCAHVLGEPARDQGGKIRFGGSTPAARDGEKADILAELETTRFADQPVVCYRTKDGELLFGWQLQPKLDAAAVRPRDFVLVIDTSASQAGGALQAAVKFAETLVAHLNPDDRVAVRTANVKGSDLTRGFKEAAQAQVALKPLAAELPMGAVDLKATLTEALQAFEGRPGRQQVLIYLGDGISILNPFRAPDLAEMARKMVKEEVVFFPVPIGRNIDPTTLHGLASNTGGAPLRILPGDTPEASAQRALETLAAPILYPTEVAMSPEIAQRFPAEGLPPLRADAPTLVLGKLKAMARLTATVKGMVAGKPVTVTISNDVPEPELGNFFLAGMYKQWEADKAQPAMVRADRALAFAEQQNQLARAECIAQAELAIGELRYDVAVRLFEQAVDLEPDNVEAQAKLELAKELRDGKITRQQLQEKMKARGLKPRKNVLKNGQGEAVALHQEPKGAPQPKGDDDKPIAPPQGGEDALQEAKRRQQIEDQRAGQIADEAIRQAADLLRRNPDDAAEVLKRALENVRNNFALSERARAALASRLEAAHRNVVIRGGAIKQDIEAQREAAARASARRDLLLATANQEARIRERMRVFDNLMAQARELEAMRQAIAIRQDLISQGSAVPVAVTAGMYMAHAAYHHRELFELNLIRRERYLLAQLQVERSAIPFPDEPPVQFPPAATWRKLSDDRLKRYQATPLAAGDPERARRTWSKLTTPINFGGIDDAKTTLREALDVLSDRYDIRFELYEDDFVDPQNGNVIKEVPETPIADRPGGIPKMKNVALTRVLRMILAEVNKRHPVKATFIIRDDTVEIVPGKLAAEELVTVSHDVGDLVIPIPNSFNQQAIQQSGSLFGSFGAQGGFGGFAGLGGAFGFQGGALGALGGGIGGLGGLGALGGGIGGLGGLGALGVGGGLGALGVGGGLGALGAGGGALGVGGALGAAGALGALGGGGIQGGVNLGVGGGLAGLGGGQLGQFGNLGGQFGLQGGDHYPILIATIRIAVGDGANDWGPLDPYTASLIPKQPDEDNTTTPTGKSSLGPYRPALALFVKGPSQIFHRKVRPTPPVGLNAPMAFDNKRERDRDVARNDRAKPDGGVAAAGNDRGDDPNRKGGRPNVEVDPKAYWQEALARGVDNPALIPECVDFLARANKWDHVAELLKTSLRQGVVVAPWAYQALAIALRETKASPDEIERAEVSSADLEPLDARGFLKAAKAMEELKRPERALAFCRQAAALDPNSGAAFRNALVYAEAAKDRDGMAWAAGELLQRDWPRDNDVVHETAQQQLERLVRTLTTENRREEAGKLVETLRTNRRRDLEITLLWSDATTGDLDLKVEEPTGTVCSWLNRQTLGGGTLLGDRVPGQKELRDKTASETYVAARAFSGKYKVTVERNWGRSLGDKAQLRVVRHRGTPQEREELITLDVSKKAEVTLDLADGRRTEAANVAPVAVDEQPEPDDAVVDSSKVVEGLRSLAYPGQTTGVTAIRGGLGALGSSRSPMPLREPRRPTNESPVFQTRVSPFAANTLDVAAQATVSSDRRYVRFSLSPVFNTVAGSRSQPVVRNPLIPGAPPPSP